MKVIVKYFEVQYAIDSDFFDSMNLAESKNMNVELDMSIQDIAVAAFGDIGHQLVLFDPIENYPIYELDYIIRENRVVWSISPCFLTLAELIENIESYKKEQIVLYFANPSCRGDLDPEIYSIIENIFEEINQLIINYPAQAMLMGSAVKLLGKKIFPKVSSFLREQQVYGADHQKIKKLLYSKENWELIDIAYRFNTSKEIAEEILLIYGFERLGESNQFVLKSRIDVPEVNSK